MLSCHPPFQVPVKILTEILTAAQSVLSSVEELDEGNTLELASLNTKLVADVLDAQLEEQDSFDKGAPSETAFTTELDQVKSGRLPAIQESRAERKVSTTPSVSPSIFSDSSKASSNSKAPSKTAPSIVSLSEVSSLS